MRLSESRSNAKIIQKIPPERLFGIGDKLFRIGITVEPPIEDPENDDLLEDELSDNANGNKLEKSKREEENNNREKGSTGGGSTPSLQSNKPGNSTSSQSSKQKVFDYLKQLQDPLNMEQIYNIQQEMELEEDEDEMEGILTEDGEAIVEDKEEVIFSPQLNPGNAFSSLHSQNETMTQHESKEEKNKWGPVQAFRKSNRVEVGGRSMLEIAVNTKKVQNLEVTKKDIQGTIIKNSFELFSNPNFLDVAKKIGVEIDTSYNIPVETSSSFSLPLSEGQTANTTSQKSPYQVEGGLKGLQTSTTYRTTLGSQKSLGQRSLKGSLPKKVS